MPEGSFVRASTPGESEVTTVSGSAPGDNVGLHRQGRNAIAPPDQRIFLLIFEGRKLTERNRSPARQRHLQGAQGSKRDTLFVRCTCDDIDQIDIVAHLGNGGAGYDGIENTGQCLRAEAEQTRLILVDTNAHLASGLDPVEIDLFGLGIACDDLGELESNLAHLIYVRTADAILHRPSDRWPKFEREKPAKWRSEIRRPETFPASGEGARVPQRPLQRSRPG